MTGSNQSPKDRPPLRQVSTLCSLSEALARLSPDVAAHSAVSYGLASGSPSPLLEAAVLMVSAMRTPNRTTMDWQRFKDSLAQWDPTAASASVLQARNFDDNVRWTANRERT